MKKITKLAALTLSAAMLTTPLYAATAQLENTVVENEVGQQEESFRLVQQGGVITEIRETWGHKSILVTNEETGLETVFLFEDALILNQGTTEAVDIDALKEGVTISAYYRDDLALAMIYPVVIPATLILVQPEGTDLPVSAKVSRFDEAFVSADNELKLHIGDDTVIVNQHGEKVTADAITEHNVLVFYTIATKSIPAQTTPSKIVVFEIEEQEEHKEEHHDYSELRQQLIEASYKQGDVSMVPLRDMADALGYDITWNSADRSALLEKEDHAILVTIGNKAYTVDTVDYTFEVAPELTDSKTFVPLALLEQLIRMQ